MLVLVFVCVVVNYMDRANISVAAPALSRQLGMSSVQLGYIFSAFGWTYAALQIPGGLLANLVTPRRLYAFSLMLWSVATLAQGLVRSFGALFGLRLAIGAFEAPAYPVNNRVVTAWFPENERATAIACYTSGQYVGLAFLAPVMAGWLNVFGWRSLFIVTGLVGIAWGVCWYWLYREPRSHPQVSAAEIEAIRDGGGLVENEAANTADRASGQAWRECSHVFRHRKLWGIYLGQFSIASTSWFFLTWFPTYLEKYRGIALVKTGFLASIPFLAAFVGVLASGFVSDLLARRGVAVGVARKAPVIIGLALSTTIIGANYVERTPLVIFFLALAFFGNGMASITWVFVSLLAPKTLIGLTGGTFNFFGNLSGIVVPVAVGYLVRGGDFAPALVFVGALALVGIACYVFLAFSSSDASSGSKSQANRPRAARARGGNRDRRLLRREDWRRGTPSALNPARCRNCRRDSRARFLATALPDR
jgi:ACS family D-galactonate transporter-like MFS transporter